ncbi:DUF3047 domain-containing protein [Cupriavidus pinatubonensis]|uniref:DUF3047 domain-containing protein n=1 Tax=Cupriavidus pinatubonensis TaxID=248026 RepID=UPI003622E635
MAARWYRLVLTGVAVALTLAGCASTQVGPPSDPSKMAAASAIDCKVFATRVASQKSHPADDPVPDALTVANDQSIEAEAGDDGDTAPAPLLAHLPRFSAASLKNRLPVGWQPWTINRNKTPTRYTLAEVDERVVVHAQADSSASGLYVPLRDRDAGVLRWTWKTNGIIRNADNGQGQREDAPLRLFVAFDGDKGSLSLKDQLMYEMARLTTGREMPYATLMYIWGGKRAEGTVLSNPHTDRVRMIVVDTGTKHTNEWRCHERDLRADYRKAFGTDPGRVIAVGIMTDTDNTRSTAESWYGDIALD